MHGSYYPTPYLELPFEALLSPSAATTYEGRLKAVLLEAEMAINFSQSKMLLAGYLADTLGYDIAGFQAHLAHPQVLEKSNLYPLPACTKRNGSCLLCNTALFFSLLFFSIFPFPIFRYPFGSNASVPYARQEAEE